MHVFSLGLTTDFYSSVSQLECRFLCFITARKRSLGQGNIFSSVCQEFCSQGGGGSASVHAGIPPPPRSRLPPDQAPPPEQTPPGSRHTPREQTPPEQTPPTQRMLGDTVNKLAVCILLECNLVYNYELVWSYISSV